MKILQTRAITIRSKHNYFVVVVVVVFLKYNMLRNFQLGVCYVPKLQPTPAIPAPGPSLLLLRVRGHRLPPHHEGQEQERSQEQEGERER